MPSIRVSQNLNQETYFLTLSVKNLFYIFDRHNRWDILAQSLEFCREKKGLKIYEFVFMLNHIHLLVASPDVSGFVRDFKSFTSKQIRINIQETEPTVEKIFLSSDGSFQLWEKPNMPKLVESENFFLQKAQYIRSNPVKKNYVLQEEYWYWSSANKLCSLLTDEL